jgi:hypothetical protein
MVNTDQNRGSKWTGAMETKVGDERRNSWSTSGIRKGVEFMELRDAEECLFVGGKMVRVVDCTDATEGASAKGRHRVEKV